MAAMLGRLGGAGLLLAGCLLPGPGVAAAGPTFDCARAQGSVETLICHDAALQALDRRLEASYRAAQARAGNRHPPLLKAEKEGWIKGRNDCWKAAELRACVVTQYRLRIAELQARYRLVPGRGPVAYACGGNPANEIIATFFATDPPSLIAERGDQVSWMAQQPAASGARYRGHNASLWEHHGEALVGWGYGAPEMRCVVIASGAVKRD